MADQVTTPGGSAKGWTDGERVALLVSLLEAKGGPDWKSIELPAGRTQKACTHVWARMKDDAKKFSTGDAVNVGNTPKDASKCTPKRTPKSKKRTLDSDGDESATPTKPIKLPKREKGAEETVKPEPEANA